jgi:MYXO-CTERM domain-containing protein
MGRIRHGAVLRTSVTASALVLAAASATQPAHAQLVIEEGFESGQLPFGCSGNCPAVIQTADAREGSWVMKSELTQSSNDPKRTEVSVSASIINFDVGEEYWVGISIKLAANFDDPTDLNDQGMLLQWHYRDWLHPEVPDAQPLLLRYRDDEVHVHNEVLGQFLASSPPEYAQWVDWVIHVSFDDVNGINEVWRNGQQIVDFHGDTHQIEKHEGAYLKFGLYSAQYETNPPGVDFTRTVYHDELRVAGANGSYDLVAPPPIGGGGGAGGAAGDGGTATGTTGGSAGQTPTGGSGGAAGAATAPPVSNAADAGDDGSCSCATAGAGQKRPAWLLLILAGALCIARRRQGAP